MAHRGVRPFEGAGPSIADVETLGQEIRESLLALVGEDEAHAPRPTDLSREWRLEQTLCVRVCSALRETDPFASLYQLPAVANLSGLITTAKLRRVEPDKIQRAEQAVRELKDLIAIFGGKKSNLDTLISGCVSEAREKLHRSSKQSIFRGMTALMGVQTDVALTSFFVYPSSAGDTLDVLAIYGSHGLRRLRPDLSTVLGGRPLIGVDVADALPIAQDRLTQGDFRDGAYAAALRGFCTTPLPEINVITEGGQLLYVLPGGRDQGFAPLDLFFASIDRGLPPLVGESDTQFTFAPRGPIATLVFDLHLHRDTGPVIGQTIQVERADQVLATYQPDSSLRFAEHCERVDALGTSRRAMSTRELPQYAPMVDHVSTLMGWREGDFTLMRAIVKYPLVGFRYLVSVKHSTAP